VPRWRDCKVADKQLDRDSKRGRLRCQALRVYDEWLANRRAELVELKSNLLGRLRLDSQKSGNSASQSYGCHGREHSIGFLSKRLPLFLRQIMSDHFQGEISTPESPPADRQLRILVA
jgi:hypothetical protein